MNGWRMTTMQVKFPVSSTYVSDPAVTHYVESIGDDSAGIQGWYTSEFDAHRVARFLKQRGHTNVAVVPYNHANQRNERGNNHLLGF